MKEKLQIGDRVKCLDDDGQYRYLYSRRNRLVVGKTYTVANTCIYLGEQEVQLAYKGRVWWFSKRFVKV